MTAAADNGFAASVQAMTETVRSACADPADAVRLLSSLAGYDPGGASSSAPVGGAVFTLTVSMGKLFRRAALSSLARACADYEPSSYDDALAVRLAVAPIYDAEILVAGDAEEDASYQALRSLRSAVLDDLIARGSDLARLTTITTNLPQPSLAIAYRLYRDASRSDDLIAQAGAVHPGFMPTSFATLSS